jgi:hypothetical protein
LNIMSEKKVQNTSSARAASGATSGGVARDTEGVEISGGYPGYDPRAAGDSIADPEPEHVIFELYSGCEGFPPALEAAAQEFRKDMNTFCEPIMKRLADRNKICAKYCNGSMLHGGAWFVKSSKGKALFLYTGKLCYDGAEPDEKNSKSVKGRMKTQEIHTRAEMNETTVNETCYGFNLPVLVKLRADDGHLYHVQICVISNHQSMNSETPEGRGRLLTCGGLLNHSCRDSSGEFLVISLEQLLKDEKKHKDQDGKYMLSKSRAVHGENPEYSDESESDDSELSHVKAAKNTAEGRRHGAAGGCSDESSEDETNDESCINTYSLLLDNDLVEAFLEDDVCDDEENYLPGMLCMVITKRHCDERYEFTLDYGHTTSNTKITNTTDYNMVTFWRPKKSVHAEFKVRCLKDPTFAQTNEVIDCQCESEAFKYENEHRDKRREKLDPDDAADLKRYGVNEPGIKGPCPANVARIAPKESADEASVRVLNEAYLLEYTATNDRINAARDEETIKFLVETDKDFTLTGPLLGYHGFPADLKEILEEIVIKTNERLQVLMDKLKHVHGFFGIGRHESFLPGKQLVHFNGKSDIPKGMIINISVGVLLPKNIVPANFLPNTLDLPGTCISGYDVCLVLLRSDPRPDEPLGWCSIAAFPNGCNANVHIIHGRDRFDCLDDYLPGDVLGNLRKPLSTHTNFTAENFFGLGISMSNIGSNSRLMVSKSLLSNTTNPILKGSEVDETTFTPGTFLHRCNCNYPDKCPAWMFECVCECLNQHKSTKQPPVSTENFAEEIESLNPHTLSQSKVRFEMSSDEKNLLARLRLFRDDGTATYEVGRNSLFSYDRERYAGIPIKLPEVINKRPIIEIVGDKQAPELHGRNVMLVPRSKTKIVPSVVPNLELPDHVGESRKQTEDETGLSTESDSDHDEQSKSNDSNHPTQPGINEGQDRACLQEKTNSVMVFNHPETPGGVKHGREEETSPPDAPTRKAATGHIPEKEAEGSDSDVICLDESPVLKTPVRRQGNADACQSEGRPSTSGQNGDTLIDLVDSPESPVAQIDGAGPAVPRPRSESLDRASAGGAAATSYDFTSDDEGFNPADHDDQYPESPSDAQERYRMEHCTEATGEGAGEMDGSTETSHEMEKKKRRADGRRSISGKTKKALIYEYVTEAKRIKDLNNENHLKLMNDIRDFKCKLEKMEAELNQSYDQKVSGLDAAKTRAIMRSDIQGLKEKLEKLEVVKQDFDTAIISCNQYNHSKNFLNKNKDALDIEELISALPKYEFTYTIPDDSALLRTLSKITGFGSSGEGGSGK